MNYAQAQKVLKEIQVRVGGEVKKFEYSSGEMGADYAMIVLTSEYKLLSLYGNFEFSLMDELGYSCLINAKNMAQFLKELEELYPAPKEHKYLSDDIYCPECKSENVVWGDFEPGIKSFSNKDDYAFREHSCKDCGISWIEFYDLSYIEIEE